MPSCQKNSGASLVLDRVEERVVPLVDAHVDIDIGEVERDHGGEQRPGAAASRRAPIGRGEPPGLANDASLFAVDRRNSRRLSVRTGDHGATRSRQGSCPRHRPRACATGLCQPHRGAARQRPPRRSSGPGTRWRPPHRRGEIVGSRFPQRPQMAASIATSATVCPSPCRPISRRRSSPRIAASSWRTRSAP